MHVCALFRQEMGICTYLKIRHLQDGACREQNVSRQRDGPKSGRSGPLTKYGICFQIVTATLWKVSENETLSQNETVSLDAGRESCFRFWAWAEADRVPGPSPKSQRDCASHRKTACLQTDRTGRARSRFGRPIRRASPSSPQFRNPLQRGWNRWG